MFAVNSLAAAAMPFIADTGAFSQAHFPAWNNPGPAESQLWVKLRPTDLGCNGAAGIA
jgi:hypothetical protein